MKDLSFLILICLCCFFVQAIEMSDYEKKLFEDNLSSSVAGNGSGFQIWSDFFYSDGSEFRKPNHEYTEGLGSELDHGHETQGILHIHDYDKGTGNPVIEKWILIKNDYVDIFSWDSSNIFNPADEL